MLGFPDMVGMDDGDLLGKLDDEGSSLGASLGLLDGSDDGTSLGAALGTFTHWPEPSQIPSGDSGVGASGLMKQS